MRQLRTFQPANGREGPGIVLGGCWAHVFTKFEEAKSDHPEAAKALSWIGERHEIDREAGADLSCKAELRRTRSRAVLDRMRDWLWSHASLKSLAIGKAASYTVANWSRLTRFVDDARVPLDSNATERAIRGPVVGRKNHYGSEVTSRHRGRRDALLDLETAKLHHVDPAEYLAAAVRAADNGSALMPREFAPAQPD